MDRTYTFESTSDRSSGIKSVSQGQTVDKPKKLKQRRQT